MNIKSNDQKRFLWCHVRHINPSKEHPERITNVDRKIACSLNYDEIKFLVEEKILKRLKCKIIFVLMCFVMKMRWFFQFMYLIKNLKTL